MKNVILAAVVVAVVVIGYFWYAGRPPQEDPETPEPVAADVVDETDDAAEPVTGD